MSSMAGIRAILLASVLTSLSLRGAGANAQDTADLKPFTSGEPYLGKFETGLYPGGKNALPDAHRKAGERMAAMIRPLDANGLPDDKEGRILGLVLGHSNCSQYFDGLLRHLEGKKESLHPRLELLNAAQSGQVLQSMVTLRGGVWNSAKELMSRPGYSANQVQVLFVHPTYHRANKERSDVTGEYPQKLKQMQADLAKILEHAVTLFPNLRIAYLTADGYRGFAGLEPYVWMEAFGIKWLIESQIRQENGTAFEGAGRRLPWLQWGPYFWDSTWGRDYFSDGVHPAAKAREIFSKRYWELLASDPIAKPWFLNPARR